jgi:AcrR family transcriptional regulator
MTKADPAVHAGPGRPRSEDVTTRILDATTELLLESGIEGTTIHAVAARAGVARATIYLRWPHPEDLVNAALRRAMGRPVMSPSGDIEADLGAAAEQARAIFSSPAFHAVLPSLVRALLRDRTKPGAMSYDFVAPGRAILSREYEELAGEAGLRTDLEPAMVMDLIVGGVLNRLLTTGKAPTREYARQVTEIVIAGLRRTHDKDR